MIVPNIYYLSKPGKLKVPHNKHMELNEKYRVQFCHALREIVQGVERESPQSKFLCIAWIIIVEQSFFLQWTHSLLFVEALAIVGEWKMTPTRSIEHTT